jgi:hypothetical protein
MDIGFPLCGRYDKIPAPSAIMIVMKGTYISSALPHGMNSKEF